MINLGAVVRDGMDELLKNEWRTDYLHASDIGFTIDPDDGGKCMRQFWLRHEEADRKEVGPGRQLMFEQGNHLEKKVMEYLHSGFRQHDVDIIAEQMNVSLGLPEGVRGRLDFLICSDDSVAVVDIKSKRGGAFQHMDDGPKERNKMQVVVYSWAISKMMQFSPDYGGILVVDREGQNFVRDFWFPITDSLIERAEDGFRRLEKVRGSNTPPPRLDVDISTRENKNNHAIYVKQPWQCRYCDFHEVSCRGAMPSSMETNRVVGYYENGEVRFKDDYSKLEKFARDAVVKHFEGEQR